MLASSLVTLGLEQNGSLETRNLAEGKLSVVWGDGEGWPQTPIGRKSTVAFKGD